MDLHDVAPPHGDPRRRIPRRTVDRRVRQHGPAQLHAPQGAGLTGEPLDREVALRAARSLAGRSPWSGSFRLVTLEQELAAAAKPAADAVRDVTGLDAPGDPVVLTVDRLGWVEANLASFETLMPPLVSGGAAARKAASVQLGAVLGVLSRRVLGQFDLVIPAGSDGAGVIRLIGENLLEAETRHGFNPRDFRMWVALHECTHRAQLGGVPWLREHVLALIRKASSSRAPGSRPTEGQFARRAIRAVVSGNPWPEAGLLGYLLSDAQRAVLEEAQALMSLLEGHATAVMNEAGRRFMVGVERMSRTLHARREGASRLLRLLGVGLKLDQYRHGEEFVLAVSRAAGGLRGVDPAWRSPAHLPTLAEIGAPNRWLDRMAQLEVR